MTDNNEWVEIWSFDSEAQAEISRQHLEDNGIECHEVNTRVTSMFATGMVGGVKLRVRKTDEEAALAILKEAIQ